MGYRKRDSEKRKQGFVPAVAFYLLSCLTVHTGEGVGSSAILTQGNNKRRGHGMLEEAFRDHAFYLQPDKGWECQAPLGSDGETTIQNQASDNLGRIVLREVPEGTLGNSYFVSGLNRSGTRDFNRYLIESPRLSP